MNKTNSAEQELLDLTRQLLDSIAAGDFATYTKLCDPMISAFEPEARGHLVEGLDFHRFYFELGGASGPRNTTIVAPSVRIWGDTELVCYLRAATRRRRASRDRDFGNAGLASAKWRRFGGMSIFIAACRANHSPDAALSPDIRHSRFTLAAASFPLPPARDGQFRIELRTQVENPSPTDEIEGSTGISGG